jgi:hypothetical protein
MSLRVPASGSTTRGKPSASVRWNLPCIQTRYILSCRLRFTSSRRSTPSCVMVNRGWASPDMSGPRRDGWTTCTDGSGGLRRVTPGALDEEESRLGGDAGQSGKSSSLAPHSPSSSPSPFSSSTSVDADPCPCCSWTCAAGGAGEPVNNNASSSAIKAREGRESQFFLGHLRYGEKGVGLN